MPLYDVTHKPDRLVDPNEDFDIIRKLKNQLPAQSWNMVLRVIKEAVDAAVANKGKLVWCSAASLFGHSSKGPKTDVDRLWERVISIVGDKCELAVGALLRSEIANRSETWLLWKEDLEARDPITGKKITRSTYWIDDNYNKPIVHSVNDLVNKFKKK